VEREPSRKQLQALPQAYLNCLELCRALNKQTNDPHVRKALCALIDELQESLAPLASHLRQRGVAAGAYGLDRQGKARIRELLGAHSVREQMLAVRRSLSHLVAWYSARLPAPRADHTGLDWLESLSAQANGMLERWDRHMVEMKATDS
jgi:hypothetical protein